MMHIGEIVKFHNNEAVVLVCLESEVLLLIDKGYVKWVDITLLDIPSTQIKQ